MAYSESKYLNFADVIDQVRAKNKLNPREWGVLRVIAKFHLNDLPFRIVDLMQMTEIASPATIHRIIHCLIDQDMVAIRSDPQDGRIKYLIPTSRALKIFRDLSVRM